MGGILRYLLFVLTKYIKRVYKNDSQVVKLTLKVIPLYRHIPAMPDGWQEPKRFIPSSPLFVLKLLSKLLMTCDDYLKRKSKRFFSAHVK